MHHKIATTIKLKHFQAEKNTETINHLQNLVDEQEQLVTSHHVIEEVLFVLLKIYPEADLVKAVFRISEIPGLILAEPSPHIGFAERYATLRGKPHMGINDALLLQLMLDADITHLFSYDEQFVSRAVDLGIKQCVSTTRHHNNSVINL